MKTLLTVILISINCLLFGQSKMVQEVSNLIKEETIDKAEKMVDDYLLKEPNNVDALMLKGNIIYFKYESSQPHIAMTANDNESIFDWSIGFLRPIVQILPKNIAKQVTDYYLKAVAIDNNRVDIHLGICNTYSNSGMTDKLIEYLPIFKKLVKEPEFEYNLCDYARNLKERGLFDDGMKVYITISEIYPETGGILSDIAGEYILYGDYVKAKKYIDLALQKPAPDEMTLRNAFLIYSLLGDYANALDLANKLSVLLKNKDYLLYQALLEMKDGKDYKLTIKDFLNSNPTNLEEKKLGELLNSNKFNASIEDYKSMTKFEVNNGFNVVIHKIFATKYPQEFEPKFNLGETFTFAQLFENAIETFNSINITGLNKLEKERFLFCSAYANYKKGNTEIAINLWNPLLESKKFYYKSAAAYFIGRYYENQNNFKKAKEYYSLVSKKPEESKYATFCWNRVNKIQQ